MKTLFTFLLALCFGAGYAQEIVQLTDKGFVPGTTSEFYPRFLAPFKDKVLFTGKGSRFGYQFFMNDGTPSGTKQIAPDWVVAYSNPGFVQFKGSMYFAARDSINGNELRRFDGDTVTLLKDILPGSSGSMPLNGTNNKYQEFKEQLYFTAQDEEGVGIWRTDGTSEGTEKFHSDTSNKGFTSIEFTKIDQYLFYTILSKDSLQLWRTDGSKAGKNLVSTLSRDSRGLRSFKNDLCFIRAESMGYSFVRMNMAGEIQVLAESVLSNDVLYAVLNDELFIEFIDHGDLSVTLWKTNGTALGTKLVKELQSTMVPSWPPPRDYFLGSTATEVILSFTPGYGGEQVWSSDGTSSGTNLICNAYRSECALYNDTLYLISSSSGGDFDPHTVYYYDGEMLNTYASAPSDSLTANECSSITRNDNALFFNGNFKKDGYSQVYKVQVGNVGISEAKKDPSVSVYPNPMVVNGSVHISSVNKVANIEVYSITGQLVLSKTLNANQNTIVVTADELRSIPGEYFFILKGEKGIAHGRFSLTR